MLKWGRGWPSLPDFCLLSRFYLFMYGVMHSENCCYKSKTSAPLSPQYCLSCCAYNIGWAGSLFLRFQICQPQSYNRHNKQIAATPQNVARDASAPSTKQPHEIRSLANSINLGVCYCIIILIPFELIYMSDRQFQDEAPDPKSPTPFEDPKAWSH